MSQAPDTTIVLTPPSGSGLSAFTFTGLEVPSNIVGIGVKQMIATHKLIGGARQLDAMGVDYQPITWDGLFFGQGATDRVAQLKALAASGVVLTLAWHVFNYSVIIQSFDPDERRQFEIPYHISFEIAQDNSNPASTNLPITADQAVSDQLIQALQLSALLQAQAQGALAVLIGAVEAAVALVATAVYAVKTFISAPLSVIGSVLAPLLVATEAVNALTAFSDASIAGVSGFGGVVVGVDALTMATTLDATLNAMETESIALSLAGCLGIMTANLNSVSSSPNTITVAGGNLFTIAATVYGDATLWTAIALANGLTDPQLSGPITLTIPLNPTNTGGVLTS